MNTKTNEQIRRNVQRSANQVLLLVNQHLVETIQALIQEYKPNKQEIQKALMEHYVKIENLTKEKCCKEEYNSILSQRTRLELDQKLNDALLKCDMRSKNGSRNASKVCVAFKEAVDEVYSQIPRQVSTPLSAREFRMKYDPGAYMERNNKINSTWERVTPHIEILENGGTNKNSALPQKKVRFEHKNFENGILPNMTAPENNKGNKSIYRGRHSVPIPPDELRNLVKYKKSHAKPMSTQRNLNPNNNNNNSGYESPNSI